MPIKDNIVSDEVSAIWQADSTEQGMLIPRMTEAQRDAIASPATGLMVYNTDTDEYNYYDGAGWVALTTGGGSAAPADAKYILQQADGDLPNAQALGALSTGLAVVTTTTGVVSTVAAPTGAVVGTTDTQTLSGKTIDGDDNTVQDLALSSLKTVGANTNRFITRNGSGAVSDATALPSGTVVGTSDSQTLTNKTIDADNNTVTNIGSSEVKPELITGLSADATPDGATDYVMTYDASATALKKVLLDNLPGGGGGGGYATIEDNGTPVTQRDTVNFIPGTNVTLTVADDGGNARTNITINAGATPGGGATPATNQGRLTLTTGVPVTTTDVTGAATLYWTPYIGNYIGLYDGSSAWALHTLSEKSLSLAGLLPWSLHDIFMDYNGGTPVLASLPWTAGATGSITDATNATPIVITSAGHGLSNDDIVTISGVTGNTAANGTWRVSSVTTDTFVIGTLTNANSVGNGAYAGGGTWYKANYVGSRATALTKQDAIYVLTGATDWRFLGTIRIGATAGQTDDAVGFRGVGNYYNVDERTILQRNTTDSWADTTSGWRAQNNDFSQRVWFVVPIAERRVYALNVLPVATSSTSIFAPVGIGLDVVDNNSASVFPSTQAPVLSRYVATQAIYRDVPSAGGHYLQAVEYQSTGTITFIGDAGVTYIQSGMTGEVWA